MKADSSSREQHLQAILRYDDWVLHDFQGFGVAGSRGLGIGRIYDRSGVHLATVAQEILIRERRGEGRGERHA